MKKFNEVLNEKVDHYAGNEIIKNKIWNLIDENLIAKMDGENSDKLSILGKEKLVEELSKIVENNIIKTEISILESVKKEPTMVNEVIERLLDTKKFKKVKEDIIEDYKKIAQTIKSLEEKHPLSTVNTVSIQKQKETIQKMIENFKKKWNNEAMRWDLRRSILIENDIDGRAKELKDMLRK